MGRRTFSAEPHAPKYRQVMESLSRDILTGKYAAGQRLPSEAALVRQFGTSRITVGRAIRELVQRGLVERKAGSGSFVRQAGSPEDELLFGLLIPGLGETEIFEPICRGIASAPEAGRHALLWGHIHSAQDGPEEQALELCEQFIQRGVSGVFFAPIERSAKAGETNRAIVAQLEKARISIVLLDRCVMPYPQRCRHDLVGIDNRRAGYMATEHLLSAGARRVSFVGYAGAAPTVEARIAGFREAFAGPVCRVDAIDTASVRALLDGFRKGDGFVCANDRTAGELMRVLLELGYRIPQDVRIAGIDDVEYASLLPVPLTTVRQPCREIGEAAMAAMIARIERPAMLIRDILLECHLVVRESSGKPGHG